MTRRIHVGNAAQAIIDRVNNNNAADGASRLDWLDSIAKNTAPRYLARALLWREAITKVSASGALAQSGPELIAARWRRARERQIGGGSRPQR